MTEIQKEFYCKVIINEIKVKVIYNIHFVHKHIFDCHFYLFKVCESKQDDAITILITIMYSQFNEHCERIGIMQLISIQHIRGGFRGGGRTRRAPPL